MSKEVEKKENVLTSMTEEELELFIIRALEHHFRNNGKVRREIKNLAYGVDSDK
jgi:hypothetical protein